jgi:hypothetical protein
MSSEEERPSRKVPLRIVSGAEEPRRREQCLTSLAETDEVLGKQTLVLLRAFREIPSKGARQLVIRHALALVSLSK